MVDSRAASGPSSPIDAEDEAGWGIESSHHALVLRLDRLQDLFGPPTLDEFGGAADLTSGIERVVAELKSTRPATVHLTILVAEPELTPGVEDRLTAAIRRYCTARIQDLEHRRGALRHDGLTALLLGAPLLLVALLLTALVSQSGFPAFWRTFLGDGLLLVLAWVALWYPLDTLLWYGRPITHEIRVVEAMRRMPITVQAAEPPSPDGHAAPGEWSPDDDAASSTDARPPPNAP
jgi:hypothetical protein